MFLGAFMQKFSILISALLILLFVASCSEDDNDQSTKLYSIDQVAGISSYSNFKQNIENYQPDMTIIGKIKSSMVETDCKFDIYFDVDCGCVLDMKKIARLVKVLQLIEIPDSNLNLYGMYEKYYDYPNKDKFTINMLPAEFTQSGDRSFSLFDSLWIRNYYEPDYSITVKMEDLVLESIQYCTQGETK
jgi:hypothetical protein